LVGKNTAKATGTLGEVACAKEEKVPVRGVPPPERSWGLNRT
jgi:hypothetical protein